ncbi:SDR family oxidoreductase [Actinomadura meridiana]|uniref:SDR family oxidoreductase n=1 Tax=Actinomadura meridiana TaxID=559626 RepID=A0ABP8BUC7_9ACTN
MELRGRTALVTGGTGGIGKETARGLAALGAHVIVVGRDPARAEAAVHDLTRDSTATATPGAGVTALTADLTTLDGARVLAERVAADHDRLDVLVNNLGGAHPRRVLTADGVEATFATNVLAPYALTCRLLPLLRAAGTARVVNLTGGIPGGPLDLGNLQGEKTYLGWRFSQYNHAKTALMAMSRHLAASLASNGSPGVTVNVAYPGHAYTPGNRTLPMSAFPYVYRPLVPLLRLLGPRLMGDAARATRSSLYLAADPAMDGVTGVYVNAQTRRVPWPASVLDERACDTVWDLCHHLSTLTP